MAWGKLGSIGNVVVELGGPFPQHSTVGHRHAFHSCSVHSDPSLCSNDILWVWGLVSLQDDGKMKLVLQERGERDQLMILQISEITLRR